MVKCCWVKCCVLQYFSYIIWWTHIVPILDVITLCTPFFALWFVVWFLLVKHTWKAFVLNSWPLDWKSKPVAIQVVCKDKTLNGNDILLIWNVNECECVHLTWGCSNLIKQRSVDSSVQVTIINQLHIVQQNQHGHISRNCEGFVSTILEAGVLWWFENE